MNFIFGGDTGVSYETLQRRRRLADQMMAAASRRPTDIGSGIDSAVGSITSALLARSADKGMEAGRGEFETQYQNTLGAWDPLAEQLANPPAPTPTVSPAPENDIIERIIQQESGGNPNAVSDKGATGLMQVMPGTARDPGYGVPNIFDMASGMGVPVADQSEATLESLLLNPEVNRAFGTAYYNAMLKANGGDESLALASYNAGPGAVQEYGGVPPYRETQNYVEAINGGRAAPMQATQAQEAPPAQMTGPGVSELAQLLSSPYASDAERDVLSMLLSNTIERGRGPEFSMLSEAEEAQLGLDPAGSYQRGRDGKISRIGGSGTTINVGDKIDPRPQIGTPEKGYQYVWDAESGVYRAIPIAGGSVDRDLRDAEEAATLADENKGETAAIVSEDIDRAIAAVTASPTWTTGLAGQLLSGIGGTGARDLDSTLTTIRANIGFDQLQKMRDASPTGGALGNVTERELANLQAVLGNLETSQSSEQLLFNLERLGSLYDEIMFKLSAYPGGENAGIDPRQAAALKKSRNARNAVEIDGYRIERVD